MNIQSMVAPYHLANIERLRNILRSSKKESRIYTYTLEKIADLQFEVEEYLRQRNCNIDAEVVAKFFEI